MDSSVVISTFNGSKYIYDQLESLRCQNLPFDEIIISDDCSTDDTPDVIQSYLEANADDTRCWSFSRNNQNRGWKFNFHRLLYQADGDIIFPCDQDDIWCLEKHEVMKDVMNGHSEIDLLACLVMPLYEEGSVRVQDASIGGKDTNAEYLVLQDLTSPKSLYVTRPGCTFCVRRSFLEEIRPFWDISYPHDAVMWVLAEAKGSLGLLNRQLVNFRRHSGNASDRRAVNINSRRQDIDLQEHLLSAAEAFMQSRGYMDEGREQCVRIKREWLEARSDYLFFGKLSAARRLFEGRRLYASYQAFYADLALGIFPKASIGRRKN